MMLYARSCERPSNSSASVFFPSSVSNSYCFSTGTHGSSRRFSVTFCPSSAYSASSFASSSRAACHSSRVPTLCSVMASSSRMSRVMTRPGRVTHRSSTRYLPLELVEAGAPSPVLPVAALVGRDAAVDEQHLGRSLRLREGELDQLLVGGIVVEDPRHHEAVRPVDQRVLAARSGLPAVGPAHPHPDPSPHPQNDLRPPRLPLP